MKDDGGKAERQSEEGEKMSAEPQDLRERTRKFALRIIRLYVALPKTTEAQVIGKQMLRSGTSVGAHYREAHRGKSDPDSLPKWRVVCKNWTKPPTGWNYLRRPVLLRPNGSSRYVTNQ